MKKLIISIASIMILIPLSGASPLVERGDIIHTANARNPIKEGQPAPDFTLQTADGEQIRLSDYLGEKVLINFWASWCPPCREEMHVFENYFIANKPKAHLISINLTYAEKAIDDVQGYLRKNNLTFPVLLDTKGKTGESYQVLTLPTSIFIDSNGIIQKKWIGPLDNKTLQSILSNLK